MALLLAALAGASGTRYVRGPRRRAPFPAHVRRVYLEALMYTIDVSDLYDAFHECAAMMSSRFGFGVDTEPAFDEIVDQLELEVFLAAVAIRLANLAADVDPEDVLPLLRIREKSGEIRSGAAGTYHSHGFEHDAEGHVANRIVPGNLVPRDRSEVDLIVSLRRSGAARESSRDQEIA